MGHKCSAAPFKCLNKKLSSSKNQIVLLPNSCSRRLPRVPKLLQCIFSTTISIFLPHSDCTHTDWSRQAGFCHTFNYCWTYKLTIPPHTFLKWQKCISLARDFTLVQFSTSASANLIQLLMVLILSVLDTFHLYLAV